MADFHINTCRITSSLLSYVSNLSASSALEKGIQNLAIGDFIKDRFEELHGNQTHEISPIVL